MKKHCLPIFVCLVTVTWSCKKKEAEPLTRTQVLTDKKWQLRQSILTSPGSQEFNSYTLVRDCTRDDYWQFTSPNVWTTDEGPTKCSSRYPQTQVGSWELSNSDTKLTLTDQNFTDVYNVVRLTSDSLKMSIIIPQGSNPDATLTQTYTTLK